MAMMMRRRTQVPPLATGTFAVSHDDVPAYVLDLPVSER
jgi:hypothetical protein